MSKFIQSDGLNSEFTSDHNTGLCKIIYLCTRVVSGYPNVISEATNIAVVKMKSVIAVDDDDDDLISVCISEDTTTAIGVEDDSTSTGEYLNLC